MRIGFYNLGWIKVNNGIEPPWISRLDNKTGERLKENLKLKDAARVWKRKLFLSGLKLFHKDQSVMRVGEKGISIASLSFKR